eukprot:3141503-Prymnesium_polylepis.1
MAPITKAHGRSQSLSRDSYRLFTPSMFDGPRWPSSSIGEPAAAVDTVLAAWRPRSRGLARCGK